MSPTPTHAATNLRRLAPGLLAGLLACGDPVEAGTAAATACVESDLIAQCPPGSSPRLDAQSRAACEGSASLDLTAESGEVDGACMGEGDCQVLCQFEQPCPCGVATLTRDALVCRACTEQAACGNRICEGGESFDTCPIDCAGECEPGEERCNGDAREVCGADRAWDQLACPQADETCDETDAGTTTCVRSRI